eukprot:scaffold17615_cov131-Skeletonema_marinoi.AAC.2
MYENGSDGFSLLGGSNLNVEVREGSSLIACQNGAKDIRNLGGGTFSSNDGFICGPTKGSIVPISISICACADCPACPVSLVTVAHTQVQALSFSHPFQPPK